MGGRAEDTTWQRRICHPSLILCTPILDQDNHWMLLSHPCVSQDVLSHTQGSEHHRTGPSQYHPYLCYMMQGARRRPPCLQTVGELMKAQDIS